MSRILLVESGSRSTAERFLRFLRDQGMQFQADVVTCYEGVPEGAGDGARAYSIIDYPGGAGREKLAAELRAAKHDTLVILCTAEPVMTKWKWYLVAKLSAKPLIVNENADFFWFDRNHWRTILHFALFRLGLTGGEAVPTLTRLAVLPFSVAFLVIYAGWVHARRRMRLFLTTRQALG
jgi:hypothetical protein